MKVGLIDVDGHNFPNIPLMKLSAYHKAAGDTVEWYNTLPGEKYGIVYMSKVFSFTPDYEYFVNADKVVKGGSGYAIQTINSREVYDKSKDNPLPYEVEHTYPDYGLYPELTKDTAYGFLTRGCPRGCDFCHVKAKEGCQSYKVADLSEFWRGQKKYCIVRSEPDCLLRLARPAAAANRQQSPRKNQSRDRHSDHDRRKGRNDQEAARRVCTLRMG